MRRLECEGRVKDLDRFTYTPERLAYLRVETMKVLDLLETLGENFFGTELSPNLGGLDDLFCIASDGKRQTFIERGLESDPKVSEAGREAHRQKMLAHYYATHEAVSGQHPELFDGSEENQELFFLAAWWNSDKTLQLVESWQINLMAQSMRDIIATKLIKTIPPDWLLEDLKLSALVGVEPKKIEA